MNISCIDRKALKFGIISPIIISNSSSSGSSISIVTIIIVVIVIIKIIIDKSLYRI